MTKARGAFRPGVEPAPTPLHYTMCGLDNVWLLNGFHPEETAYGPGVRVEDAEDLHRALAAGIVADKAPMSGQELRFIRKLMGLSQNGLARLLGSSDQRVARWEKGQPLDPSAERLIRMVTRDWLGDDYHIRDALEELAELDEQTHARRDLMWEGSSWRRRSAAVAVCG